MFFFCNDLYSAPLKNISRIDGQAQFKGEVVLSGCSLSMSSAYQDINLGVIPLREIQKSNLDFEKKIQIKLLNCNLDNKTKNKTIGVFFSGLFGKINSSFNVFGSGHGIDLQIRDSHGNSSCMNKSIPFSSNDNILNYTLKIKRNFDKLKPGYFMSSIRYNVVYL